ncbi:uncharacterized protein PRCAT00005302001 [Priceomyces carsonii]|uniref:uncharacterized protein n=1 Tax=Priceomyces carsonii TaxID=28549 RepID=UPI002ED94533|nr:unnamed protein product [Priceomyces carsonii]
MERSNTNSWFKDFSFHYPNGKSKEYTERRQSTTNKYGDVTAMLMIVLLILVPILRYFVVRGYSPSRKVTIVKWTILRLNRVAHRNDLDSARTRMALALKGFILKVLFYYNTLAQIAFWTVLFMFLSFSDLNDGDLIFLAKRLGKIAAVCLPSVMFLSLRPSPLPYTLYLMLIPIHKWLSRFLILQSVAHMALYCGFFQKNHTWNKAFKTENIYGWVAIAGFIIIAITSLQKFRARFYGIFYFQHYTWSWIIVFCLQLHARPVKITNFTILNVIILSSQIFYRLKLSIATHSRLDVKVTDISGNLSLIEFPNYLLKRSSNGPGAHIRLTEYYPSIIMRIYRQIIPNYHPYTLASLPQDNYQKLIVRKTTFRIQNDHKYLISGAYDPYLLFLSSTKDNDQFSISKLQVHAKRILIVIGGSAISFALPIIRVMNYHGIPTKVVWVIRDFRDIIVLRYFDGFIHGDDFEIFVTGDERSSTEDKSMRLSKYGSIGRLSQFSHSSRMSSFRLEDNPGEEDAESNASEQGDENVNVEISVDNEEDLEDEECPRNERTLNFAFNSGSFNENGIQDAGEENENREEQDDDYGDDEVDPMTEELGNGIHGMYSPAHSRHASSFNEPFIPDSDFSETPAFQRQQFMETVNKINIENKIYKGRPKLNYKYLNWCTSGGFTQCSGPIEDGDHTVCCKDLPKNQVLNENIDLSKIWVVSAGPKGLVQNVKLWAKENSLNFYEESFFV